MILCLVALKFSPPHVFWKKQGWTLLKEGTDFEMIFKDMHRLVTLILQCFCFFCQVEIVFDISSTS